jgi:hypothetical protein
MIQRFQIRANIYDVAAERLHQLLTEVVGELSFRSRLVGYQMFLEKPDLQMSVETMQDEHPNYTMNAHLQSDVAGVAAWAKALCKRLEAADIFYLLDYIEEDENGEEIGEEFSFSHPDFEARYAAWRAKTGR